jgi:hypothetical protein
MKQRRRGICYPKSAYIQRLYVTVLFSTQIVTSKEGPSINWTSTILLLFRLICWKASTSHQPSNHAPGLLSNKSFRLLNYDGTNTVRSPISIAPLMSSSGLSPMKTETLTPRVLLKFYACQSYVGSLRQPHTLIFVDSA